MTFTKLFTSITESTIWLAPDPYRLLWITMLAMADKHGRVWGSIPGLAHRARITIDEARDGLKFLMSPDPDSRTKDNEGRRIEEMDGGWRLINHGKYRAIRDEEAIKESKRKYINTRRAKERGVENVDRSRANAEADTDTKKRKGGASRLRPLPEGFKISQRVEEWCKDKGFYRHLDEHFEKFMSYVKTKQPKYADWDEALMTCIREDWGGIRKSVGVSVSGVRPSIVCATCGEKAFTWTDGKCDPCWRKEQGKVGR